MKLGEAKALLIANEFEFEEDGGIDGGKSPTFMYTDYYPGKGDACLDGNYTADVLEALAVWMRAHA